MNRLPRTFVIFGTILACALPLRSADTQPATQLAPIVIDKPASEIKVEDASKIAQVRLAEKAILIAQMDDVMSSCDIATGKMLHTFEPTFEQRSHLVTFWLGMEVSSDESKVCFVTGDNKLSAFDIKTGKVVWTSYVDLKRYDVLRFRADDCFVAATVSNNTIAVWDIADGHEATAKLGFIPIGQSATAYPINQKSVILVTKNPNPKDPNLPLNADLFDLASGQRKHLTEVRGGFDCWVLPGGKEALVLRGKEVMRPIDSGVRVQELYWSAAERWDLKTCQKISEAAITPEIMASDQIKLSADGRFLVLRERYHRTAIWDVTAGRLAALVGPEQGCNTIDISHDGKILAATITVKDAHGTPRTMLVTYDLSKLGGTATWLK